MKNTEIKVVVSKDKKSLKEVDVILGAFRSILDQPMQYHTINISPKINISTLKDALKAEYKSDIELREGVTGGCYGARDGSYSEGFTVWVDADLLVDRCLDGEGEDQREYANVSQLLKENATLVEDATDPDWLEEFASNLGLVVKSDNSYNYAGNGGKETCGFIFDFQFTTFKSEDESGVCYMSVMYHCGGDPRGNYTSKQLWKFASVDDLYSVLLPSTMLIESEE